MRISKYFNLKIDGGDDFNPLEIKEMVDLPCEIQIKGERIYSPLLGEKYDQVYKTNRWVYSAEMIGQTSIEMFLKQQLEILVSYLDALGPFIKKYNAYAELHIWSEKTAKMTLTKKHISLLNKLGVEMDVEFC